MNIKKMLCLILATVLCIGVLSGCGELENMIPGFGRQDPSLLDRPPETAGLPDQTPPTMAASTMIARQTQKTILPRFPSLPFSAARSMK